MSSTLKSRAGKGETVLATPVVMAAYEASVESKHFEFGGPIGALGVTLSVPFFTYWLSLACTPTSGCPPWPLNAFAAFHQEGWKSIIAGREFWTGLWSDEAALVYLGWYAFCLVCWAVLPGKMVQGVVLRNGERITYPMNGQSSPSSVVTNSTEAKLGSTSFCYFFGRRCWGRGGDGDDGIGSAVVYYGALG